ncbi:MAG: ATP-grasp domain-containing protein [Blastocatellia bacterium]
MPRVLLLLPTTTYRTKAFIEAGLNLGVDIVAASELASTLAPSSPSNIIRLDLFNPQRAAEQAAEFAASHPIDAVIPVDEDTAVAAAWIARALNLSHNSVEAASTAKNKFLMREALRGAGLPVPRYWHFSVDDDIAEVARRITYPDVVKPVFLSTSRGVMRANDETEFVQSVKRLSAILDKPKVARKGGLFGREALAEEFIPGFEVALEGLLTKGKLRVLALFDKPDPLDGPFFEETIYVTPSRLPLNLQEAIAESAEAAALAIGL